MKTSAGTPVTTPPPASAIASRMGMCSGLHPAMTPMVAIVSTVARALHGDKTALVALLSAASHLQLPRVQAVVSMEG